MADDDVIDLNALIDQRLNLFSKANQTFLTKPTMGAGAARFISFGTWFTRNRRWSS